MVGEVGRNAEQLHRKRRKPPWNGRWWFPSMRIVLSFNVVMRCLPTDASFPAPEDRTASEV